MTKTDSVYELINDLSESKIEEIETSLKFSYPKLEKFTRKHVGDFLAKLDRNAYKKSTDFLKWIRGQKKRIGSLNFSPGPYMKLVNEVLLKLQVNTPKTKLVLTHDIDNPEDNFRFWPEVARMEERMGIRSTFNVLTEGSYPLDHGWLDELESRGFEIGLHGDTHDIAMGFHPLDKTERRIAKCLKKLNRKIYGFRAPALGISENLLQSLSNEGIKYDSSIVINIYHKGGIDNCYPYKYPGIDIWEIPLALQDSGLFKDRQLTDGMALRIFKEIYRIIEKFGGTMVFNSHPNHIKAHKSFYMNVLDWIKEDGIETILAKDLVLSIA